MKATVSTYAETLAKLEIHLSANVQPFLESMQKITAAFTALALKLAPGLRDSLADLARAWHLPEAPRPYRVKRGRGQRRNRRNRANCDCKTRGAWGARAGENHYTDCPRFPGGRW